MAAAPASTAAALAILVGDADATVAALAQLHAATLAGQSKRVAIGRGIGTRLPVELETRVPDAGAAHG